MSAPILLSLVSALSTAISRTLAKYVLRYTNTNDYLSVNFAVLFALLVPFAPLSFHMQFTPVAILALLIAATLDGAANYFYFKAFEIEQASTVGVLLSLSPLFTLLVSPLAAWFIPTKLTWRDILGTGLTVSGIAILNRELRRNTPGQPTAATHSTAQRLLVPLAASCLLGANTYTIKYIFDRAFMNPYTYYFLRLFLIALMAHIVFRPDLKWVNRKSLAVTAGRGIFVVIQWMAMLTALTMGEPTIVKAVSEVAPLFVLVLSFVFLKEYITRNKVAGALLIIGGLFLIAI